MHVGGPGCQDSDCCLAERKPNRLRKTRTAYLSTGVRSYNRNGIAALKVCGRGLLFRPSGAYSTITAHPMLTPWAAFLRRFAAKSRNSTRPHLRNLVVDLAVADREAGGRRFKRR